MDADQGKELQKQFNSDPWKALCTCGHPIAVHRLDWSDPDDDLRPDCTHDGCNCPDFAPAIH